MLTIDHLQDLKVARLEIHVRASADAILPPFLGSTVRGAFGHALKAIACSVPHGDCSRCLLVERCLYPRLFETSARARQNGSGIGTIPTLLKHRQATPRPFIFIPPSPSGHDNLLRARDGLLRSRVSVKAGETVVFGLALFGHAIRELPYVIYAITLMAQHGFGASRAPFALEQVFALDPDRNRQVVYTERANNVDLLEACQTTLSSLVQTRLVQLLSSVDALNDQALGKESAREITMRFITPTRLRIKGHLLETPSFKQLVTSLSLRLSLMAECFGARPLNYDYRSMIERAERATTRTSTLRLIALHRFSNRRAEKLPLDGFVGQVTFAGAGLEELFLLLIAGEFLHVGSGTAFGLGRYLLSFNPASPN